jgi:hypothetical protein
MARWRPAASSWRAAFSAASAAWAVLLLAAPLAASRPHASKLASVLIVGVYSIGRLVCHQRPERSYHVWAAQMPVCARCAGIYFGAAVAAVFAASFRNGALALRASAGRSAERLALHRPRVALALAVAPTLITLVYEWTSGGMPSHAVRAAAGVPIGVVVAWLVVAAADNQVN